MFLKDIPESNFKIRIIRKKGKQVVEGASMEKIQKAVGRLGFQELHQAGQCPPPLVKSSPQIVDVHFTHEPIFIAGRYNKWQRHISNSPWFINGKRLAEHSVGVSVLQETSIY
jgi:tRNA pseudouridine synthase 10